MRVDQGRITVALKSSARVHVPHAHNGAAASHTYKIAYVRIASEVMAEIPYYYLACIACLGDQG